MTRKMSREKRFVDADVLEADDPISNELTLDGLVQWVRIEGKLVVETGDTDADGRGGFILPLRILVP